MPRTLLRLENVNVFESCVTADISEKELIAVIGPNQSGKTTLARILQGKIRHLTGTVRYTMNPRRIAYSAHSADDAFFHYSDFYYQQRYNAFDEACAETVGRYLQFDPGSPYMSRWFDAVLPRRILSEKIIELSSGEARKVLLLKSLFKDAQIYILDNPFSGLDEEAVETFSNLFRDISRRYDKTIILLLCECPPDLECDRIIRLAPRQGTDRFGATLPADAIFYKTPRPDFQTFFHIENETLKIGAHVLINALSWRIKRGEKWLLKGANGSGKTTLLSLLHADNPSAYRYRFSLFDRRRGSGESIWEIKAKIGFMSSDMQLYFQGSRTVREIILSGFSDTMMLNRRLRDEEICQYRDLLDILGVTAIEHDPFGRLSSGEKKTVMIARAMVKNPPVLILDEPFQDLDPSRFRFLHHFLGRCADENRTVIQTAHHDHERLPGVRNVARIEQKLLWVDQTG